MIGRYETSEGGGEATERSQHCNLWQQSIRVKGPNEGRPLVWWGVSPPHHQTAGQFHYSNECFTHTGDHLGFIGAVPTLSPQNVTLPYKFCHGTVYAQGYISHAIFYSLTFTLEFELYTVFAPRDWLITRGRLKGAIKAFTCRRPFQFYFCNEVSHW